MARKKKTIKTGGHSGSRKPGEQKSVSAKAYSALKKRFDALSVQFRDALEQRTATSEILRVIASSPTQLQPVLDTLIANAVKLSGATMGHVRQFDGEFHRVVAHYGETLEMISALRDKPLPSGSAIPTGVALIEGKTIQILDVQSDPRVHLDLARKIGTRTLLMVPLLREGTPIGSLTIWRNFVEAFTESQIELVKTFADQAVIAIENVRLFKELQERNRDLTEALEQQTATSEVLGVIAGSPTELQPVLNTVVANAVRLAGAEKGHIYQHDGEFLRVTAFYNETPEEIALLRELPIKPTPGSLNLQAFIEGKSFQRLDAGEGDYQGPGRHVGARTVLAVPLLREGTAIGTITIWRSIVEAFTERQIELVKTFADQAVIAIENVRLFKQLQERNAELREALEHQTATSEVLGIISRSPTDVQPVLDAIVESAARVCGIDDVVLRLREGNALVQRAVKAGQYPSG